MSIKKPNTIYDFCDSLKSPYALAKQYFDDVILEIDVYNDTQYFYEMFAGLDEKQQDTVYNNLQRLYDFTKDTLDNSLAVWKQKFNIDFTKIRNEDDAIRCMEICAETFRNMSDEMIKQNKLYALNHLLSTADTYKRASGSVAQSDCNKKCVENDRKYYEQKKRLHKREKTIIILSLISSVVISFIIIVLCLYIYSAVGSESFVSFVNKNFIPLLFTAFASVLTTIITAYKKVMKE